MLAALCHLAVTQVLGFLGYGLVLRLQIGSRVTGWFSGYGLVLGLWVGSWVMGWFSGYRLVLGLWVGSRVTGWFLGYGLVLGLWVGSRVMGWFLGHGVWTLASARVLRLPSIAVQGFCMYLRILDPWI